MRLFLFFCFAVSACAQGFVICAVRDSDGSIFDMRSRVLNSSIGLGAPTAPATSWVGVTLKSMQPLGAPQVPILSAATPTDLVGWIAHIVDATGVPIYSLVGAGVIDRDPKLITADRQTIQRKAQKLALIDLELHLQSVQAILVTTPTDPDYLAEQATTQTTILVVKSQAGMSVSTR